MRKIKKIDIDRESAKLKVLLSVSKAVSSTLDLNEVDRLILKKAIGTMKADHGSLFILDEETSHLFLSAARGFNKDEIENIKLLGGWERINEQVVKKRKPLIVNDITTHPVFGRKKLPFSKERLPIRSFISVPLMTKKKIIGVLIVSTKKSHRRRFNTDDKNLLMALANHVAIAMLNARLYRSLNELFMSTVQSLVTAVDAKDPYTHGHSNRVMKYSMAIAKHLNTTENFLERLRLSSLLHDVGKIGIKDAILGKKGKLIGEELKHVRKHPSIGVRIVKSIVDSEKIIDGIRDHHERHNGTGYPQGLKGKEISLEGKIIAVADTYDALTTKRPYQRKFTHKEAAFEIKRSSGIQFDPKMVRAFLLSFSNEPNIWQTEKGSYLYEVIFGKK